MTIRSERRAARGTTTARVSAVKLVAAAALVVASSLLFACARETTRPEPSLPIGPVDVLLFTIDTFRADHAGCLGNPEGLTPTIDAIARTGRLAREAFAPAPLTAVSHASMLTGLEPPSHGVRENGLFQLDSDIPTLATLLKEQGFATAAFVSAFPLDKRFGLASGFDRYDDDVGGDLGWMQYAERSAAATADAVLDWLHAQDPQERWFAWVHFFDPHYPHVATRDWSRLRHLDDYAREIREADHQLRRIVREMRGRDGGRGPVIAILSDHGEGQGDHGELSHGLLIYEDTLRGLFALTAPPGTPARDRLGSGHFPGVVRYTDLVPTLFDVLELPFTERVDGRSLLAAGSTSGAGAYSETYYPALHYQWSPLTGWRDERWSYVGGPDPELFDRVVDPGERRNVIGDHPEVAERLAARVNAVARDPDPSSTMAASAETREKLAALGYLSASDEVTYDSDKDPKKLIGAANALFRGMTLLSRGQPQAAQSHFLRAYQTDPDNASVSFYLATTYRELGDTRTAIGYYRRAVDLSSRAAEAFAHLAILEFDRGKRDEAFLLLERGLRTTPDSFVLLLTSGDLLRDVGRREEAEAHYRQAVEAEPERPEPWAALARLAMADGRRREAEELWEKAQERDGAGVLARMPLEGPAGQ